MKLDDKHWKDLVQAARADLPPAVDEARIVAAYAANKAADTADWISELGRLFGRPGLQLGLGLGGMVALTAGLLLSYAPPSSIPSDTWAESVIALEVSPS